MAKEKDTLQKKAMGERLKALEGQNATRVAEAESQAILLAGRVERDPLITELARLRILKMQQSTRSAEAETVTTMEKGLRARLRAMGMDAEKIDVAVENAARLTPSLRAAAPEAVVGQFQQPAQGLITPQAPPPGAGLLNVSPQQGVFPLAQTAEEAAETAAARATRAARPHPQRTAASRPRTRATEERFEMIRELVGSDMRKASGEFTKLVRAAEKSGDEAGLDALREFAAEHFPHIKFTRNSGAAL
jgi:hypothetical protein